MDLHTYLGVGVGMEVAGQESEREFHRRRRGMNGNLRVLLVFFNFMIF
jgi:hypothetical protein